MNIIITGAVGFIGFNLAKYLLKKSPHINIYAIDNINNYYSTKLKKDRLNILKKHKNFYFFKSDINCIANISRLNKIKIQYIIHLAAQAGVRYSIKNPKKYLESNINGFFKILEFCKQRKINKVVYASSSSVYGDQKKFPLNEQLKINPLNFYGFSKKNNEEMAEIYSKLYKINLIGLRFFTVYGEWGRPDMFMLKYLRYLFYKKPKFYLYNYGNHFRDFTYIGDVVKIIDKILKPKNFDKHKIFNICSNRPVKLTSVIQKINLITGKNLKIAKTKLQIADIIKTHGCNKKIIRFVNHKKFATLNFGLNNLINWFKEYKWKKI